MSTTSEILTPLSCRASAMETQQPAKSEIDNGFDQASQVLMHEDVCFYCNKKDQELVYCSFCPKSYHAHCLPPGTKITTPRWGCPSHKCMICGAATSKSRGKIYRCVLCPSAFCFTHLPEESEVLPNNPYNFMGYKTTSFLFIKCKPCLEKHPELRAKSTPDKRRRDGEDGFSSDEDGKANDKYKRRKIVKISEEDMATVPVPRPTLIKTEGTRTKPDIQLVEEIKQIINTRDLLQKDIADDLHVSQSIISQYLNNQARKNGWDALEAKLRLWTERVHKRGDEKRAPTTNTAAVTPARSSESANSEYNRHQEEHKDERWRNDNARHAMHNTNNNAAQSGNSEQRSYWDSYAPVKNDGKKSASFTNYSAGPAMYGYEGHMMMNGHAPSPLEQSYAMHQQFFKPAALTGHLNGNPSANNSNNSPGNSSPATTPSSNGTAAATNNTPSIFNSPNVQLPPLVTHGNPYEYAAYPSPHMFRQPFPPQMNYPMQPVSGYAYLAQGFTPMPAYPIPSPQSTFLAPPLGTGGGPAHFQRHEEYFNNANANANANNSSTSASQQSSK